jgi:DNA polymerase-3 subunit chi
LPELWFYHLERARVEDALPELLTKLLARDGRALVISPEEGRLAALDQHLWAFRDDSFLPHAMADGPHAADQPVLLAGAPDNLNQASMLFCLDGADPGDVSAFERVVVMFEASDETALAKARALWSVHKKTDTLISYWKQDEAGRWKKQA